MKSVPYPDSLLPLVLARLWLSGPTARHWLGHRGRDGVEFTTSFDLNRTAEPARAVAAGIERLRTAALVPWSVIAEAGRSEHGCFTWDGRQLQAIAAYSEALGRYCSLMATSGAPTLLLAGFPMHRIKNIEPWADTAAKLRTLRPIRGTVLDTCTGLGYSAIRAARHAEKVITVELDPTVLELAALNPWSLELFHDPRIEQVVGDVAEWISSVPDESFERIMHDPPSVELAGELYGERFYRELFRVLRRGGRLFHYTGDPHSQHGRRVVRGVVRRLQEAGFRRIRVDGRAHGVVAWK